MRNLYFNSVVLQESCSFCKQRFLDGAARFITGPFPLMQFCSSDCARRFLEEQREGKRIADTSPKAGNAPYSHP